ncbi:MAG: DNA polymerase IV [bacterium]|nr:DNA polymerase IV [bacterium]
MKDRSIIHLDMDAFFASVEQLDNPEYRGKPVIVGGTPEGRGVVSAASYEARKFGVFSAMSAARARQLCPGGIFVRGNMDRYVEVSHQIGSIFDSFTPLVEPLSLDEAFLDVTGCLKLFGDAETIARKIKDQILEETGLVASVGISHNKFLAKLASDMDKPDGFVVIPKGKEKEILAGLPVGRLWGVGKKCDAVLAGAGVKTVANLLAYSPTALEILIGTERAAHLRALAVGQDDRPVIPDTSAKSIGNEVTFAEDISDSDELKHVIASLADKVAWRLRRSDLHCKTITLKARFADFTTNTRAKSLSEPTDSTIEIRDVAWDLFDTKLKRGGRSIRLVGVAVSGFSDLAIQGNLFQDKNKEEDKKIDRVMDKLAEKYGRGTLKRGR